MSIYEEACCDCNVRAADGACWQRPPGSNGDCYLTETLKPGQQRSWENAREHCELRGSHLVFFANEGEYNMVVEWLTTKALKKNAEWMAQIEMSGLDFWLGARRRRRAAAPRRDAADARALPLTGYVDAENEGFVECDSPDGRCSSKFNQFADRHENSEANNCADPRGHATRVSRVSCDGLRARPPGDAM